MLRAERRMGIVIKLTRIMLFLPAFTVLGWLFFSVASNFDSSVQRTTSFYKNNLGDLLFVATTYSLTVIFHFVLGLLSFLFLLDLMNRGPRFLLLTKAFTRIATGLPISLICLSIVWPLDFFGYASLLLKHAPFLAMLFAISLLPTTVFLTCDFVIVSFEDHAHELEAVAAIGIPRLMTLRRIIVFRRQTLRYLSNVSLFTSFRAIAELGFLKSIMEEGRHSTFQQFIGNFYATFRPDDFAALGLSLFIVAAIGIFISLVLR
jgi:hypothetical protein